MKIAVFDDNIYSLHTIEKYIDDYFANTLSPLYDIFSFSDPIEFQEFFKTNLSDIYFIDIAIESNKKFGLECAKEIRENQDNAHIVFITSIAEYMPLSFDAMIRPTNYLVKPLSEEKLLETLDNIVKSLVKRKITLKSNYTVYQLDINDILYIIQERNKMIVYTKNGVLSIYRTLKSVQSELGNDFILVDKSVLINAQKISKVDFKNNCIIINDGKKLLMSSRGKKLLKNFLGESINGL